MSEPETPTSNDPHLLQDSPDTTPSARRSSHDLWQHVPESHRSVAEFLDSSILYSPERSTDGDYKWKDLNEEGERHSFTIEEAFHICNTYFSTFHIWLPIVSKKRLSRLSPRMLERADVCTLLLAMQVIGSEHQGRHPLYLRIKSLLATLEHLGRFTTDLLATYVLVAFYELGQGIFPAAYLSIANCSRLCLMLGLHDKKRVSPMLPRAATWTETEERRRLWWAVLILDRYVHVGLRLRPLSIPDIPAGEILPADDENWDCGELTVNPLLVMSIDATTTPTPAYARACQATHLLGRVCQHINHTPTASDDVAAHFLEARQLSQAFFALLAMLDHESPAAEQRQRQRLFVARALCYSALLLLTEVHSCIELDDLETVGGNLASRVELQQFAIDTIKAVSGQVVQFACELEQYINESRTSEVSPLVLNCLYSAAGTLAWYAKETDNEEYTTGYLTIKQVMLRIEPKWRVAGAEPNPSFYLDRY